MSTKAIPQELVSNKVITRWGQVGQKFLALAEEFPESKYDYKPLDGVRTFAGVLRHVAFWNQYVAASLRGQKADDVANELAKDEYPTKRQIVDVLRSSAADAADALKDRTASLSPEAAEMIITFIEHTSEHYGQLVAYARLNGVVPPASRA